MTPCISPRTTSTKTSFFALAVSALVSLTTLQGATLEEIEKKTDKALAVNVLPKERLKALVALYKETKDVYCYKLQNEIRHHAAGCNDDEAYMDAYNEVLKNQVMQGYFTGLLVTGDNSKGGKKIADRLEDKAGKAKKYPFYRAVCYMLAGDFYREDKKNSSATAAYKKILAMTEPGLEEYKKMASERLKPDAPAN